MKFVDNYLLFQLAVISHTFSAEFHEYLKQQDMRPAKWRILSNVMDRPGMFVTELASVTLLEQSHVTKLIDQLCEEKLLVKRPSPDDRRRVQVFISERGKAVVRPLIEAALVHEKKIMTQLDPQDAERLKTILGNLVQPHLAKLNSVEG